MRSFFPSVVLLCVSAASPARGQSTDSVRLSLDDAVKRAVSSSDEARIAAAGVSLADAQVTTARSTGLPQIRINSNYNQIIESSRAKVVNAILTQPFTYGSSAVLSQTFFQGGRVVAGARAAGEVREAARFTEKEVKDRLAVNAQRFYLQSVLARQLVSIQEKTVALADARMHQIEQLEKGGRAARFDVLRSRVDRANLEPALLQARSNQELADIALRQLLSIPANQPLALTTALDTAQLHALVAQAAQADAATDAKMTERGLVRAAEATASARRQGVRVSFADYLPTITGSFTTGYTALPSSNGFPTLWGRTANSFCPAGSPATRVCQNNGWFPDRSFAVQLTWNIFDGLRTKGAVDQARAAANIADLQLTGARRQAETEHAAAAAEFSRARAAFDAQRQNAEEAQEAYTIAALRFDRGLSTLLEVTDSQNALLVAQVNAARASVDLFVAIAELARTTGREIPLAPTRPSAR